MSPGQDNLDAELFKADPKLAATILQPPFTDGRAKKYLMTGPKEGLSRSPRKEPGMTATTGGGHSSVRAEQDTGQGHHQKNVRRCRQDTENRTSWVQKAKRMC